ncbi:unnamed protein product [Didymodactylos carnosus]|uniref:Uncharacterized protein n=1 Tax=Didymodactylos carnosus TaxID=1234261 RepID=A0A8S2F4Q9_9BILA|nr:unnamed protein product [Didymodactylos carnosus]CAF4201078.1 unnamed protein product [Didymodactylos carnosus]
MGSEIDKDNRVTNSISNPNVCNPDNHNIDLEDITDNHDDFQTQLSHREKQKLKRQRHDQNGDESSNFTPKRNRNDNNDSHQKRISENTNQYATSSYFNTNRIYRKQDQEKCYLLYADTATQFNFLLNTENWPDGICNNQYSVELLRKISSFSIVVKNVPAQWNAADFGEELKQSYSTIVRAERFFIKGGRPISKVRVDFSPNKELAEILKMKRILLDDEYTSYQIGPYVPPIHIVRCYICQAYDDHIAAYCPNKENPICFKCEQNHVYDRTCQNETRCAHCQGGHMAGNPNCPVKIERRQIKTQQNRTSNDKQMPLVPQQQGIWANTPGRLPLCNASITSLTNDNTNYWKEQREISNIIYGQVKGQNKQKLTPLYNKLMNYMGNNDIKFGNGNDEVNVQQYCEQSSDENMNSLVT